MPRIARVAPGGLIQHVYNRGNGRMKLFRKPADYDAFLNLLGEALDRVPGVRLLSYCLMPNHWHLVLWPTNVGELSGFMRWLSNTHVRRFRQHTVGQGHVYQGRFKSFPVQEDRHLLLLMRYVEANPKRAKLVKQAEHWRWSSLTAARSPTGRKLLSPSPVTRSRNWLNKVNQPLDKPDLNAARQSLKRGRPLGETEWVNKTATTHGLTFTLRPLGRPKKVIKI